jgi:predicted esterase
MKKTLLLILLAFVFISAKAQDYIAMGDSCFKAKDYPSAAKNYDLFLAKIESRSNMIAYKSAKAWAMAADKERTIAAVKIYVKNNYENDYPIFSNMLIREKAFDLVKDDERYKAILAAVIAKENIIKAEEKKKADSIAAYQVRLEKEGLSGKLKLDYGSAFEIFKNIKAYNNYPAIKHEIISLQFKITDSLHTAFLVVLPKDYDARKSYTLLFFLHGAVSSNTGYPDYADARDTSSWNRYYTKYAAINKVIMVYPMGNRDYNWMYPDKGFYMVPAMLKQIKQVINVDNNRVFISGHSNGATGSFSYALKQPSEFAGFYGFNTRPRVATGGTYVRNLLNRSWFNVSVDQDYYYPPAAHDSLTKVMKELHADYQDHRYNGFPHWLPQFDESEPAYQLLFADLVKRKRNPFRPILTWECDDVKYGRCDWLGITSLDTATADKSFWQNAINYKIKKWVVLDKEAKAHIVDTLMNGFVYRKRSGAVKATYSNNVFAIRTSAVGSVRIYLSPEMVDFRQPVTITVNGKRCFKAKVTYNKQFMTDEFEATLDKAALWVNYIDVEVKAKGK